MINGLGVLGWGVGGIEAEAVMLGQPYFMLIPEVVGMKLIGELPLGTTATDLVLTATQMLRKKGRGRQVRRVLTAPASPASAWPTAPRSPTWRPSTAPRWASSRSIRRPSATSSAPAATRPWWSGSSVTRKEQGLFRTDQTPDPEFTSTLTLDLSTVVPSLAGPKRPQDLVPLTELKRNFQVSLPELMTPGVPAARRELAAADCSPAGTTKAAPNPSPC